MSRRDEIEELYELDEVETSWMKQHEEEMRISDMMGYFKMLSKSNVTGELVNATIEAIIIELNKDFKLDVQASAE